MKDKHLLAHIFVSCIGCPFHIEITLEGVVVGMEKCHLGTCQRDLLVVHDQCSL